MASSDSTESTLASLLTQLSQWQATQTQGVSAVSLKLPEFWIKSPEVWFARIEALFGTKNISQDQTMYDYVVSALDVNTAEEIQSVLINPPTVDKYNTLKKALIKTFGKSQAQKDAELLNMSGLGDRRPTALMRKINALNDDPKTLKRALFLSNLPNDIRTILAGHNITDTEELAETADRIWESRITGINHISTDPENVLEVNAIAPVYAHSRGSKRFHRTESTGKSTQAPSAAQSRFVCFYHTKFGPEARRCQSGCSFASLTKKQFSLGNERAGH